MKVVIFSTKSTFSGDSFGGAERSLALMAKRLGELGNEVAFVAIPHKKRIARARLVKESSFSVHFIPVFNLPFQRFSLIKRTNKRIQEIIWNRYMTRNFSGYDVGHCFSPQDATLFLNWKKKHELAIKIIVRCVNLVWKNDEVGQKRIKKVMDGIYSKVDSVCFIQKKQSEEFVRMSAEKFGVTLNDFFVQDIGNEIDKSLPEWAPPADGKFTIFMMARFSEDQKRQDVLIEAFRRLNLDQSELIFAGDGKRKKMYQELCQKDDFLRDRVKFLGFVDKPVLTSALLTSSLFCLAADYEGLCKSVLEAMSVGIPVLVSDVSVLNEYIEHDENGLLARNTPEDWEAKLQYFRQLSFADQKKIGDNAKQFILDTYDSEVCGEKIQEQFRRVADL